MNYAKIIMLCCGWLALSATTYSDEKGHTLNNPDHMVVYKSPTCGCCGGWANHMTEAGFSIAIHHPEDLNHIKDTLGVSPRYQACHTSVQDGYFFEGHIPADVVKRFLEEKPDNTVGLAVPGMPMGSPGMNVAGDYRPYEVLKIHRDGSSVPYARVSVDGVVFLEGES